MQPLQHPQHSHSCRLACGGTAGALRIGRARRYTRVGNRSKSVRLSRALSMKISERCHAAPRRPRPGMRGAHVAWSMGRFSEHRAAPRRCQLGPFPARPSRTAWPARLLVADTLSPSRGQAASWCVSPACPRLSPSTPFARCHGHAGHAASSCGFGQPPGPGRSPVPPNASHRLASPRMASHAGRVTVTARSSSTRQKLCLESQGHKGPFQRSRD